MARSSASCSAGGATREAPQQRSLQLGGAGARGLDLARVPGASDAATTPACEEGGRWPVAEGLEAGGEIRASDAASAGASGGGARGGDPMPTLVEMSDGEHSTATYSTGDAASSTAGDATADEGGGSLRLPAGGSSSTQTSEMGGGGGGADARGPGMPTSASSTSLAAEGRTPSVFQKVGARLGLSGMAPSARSGSLPTGRAGSSRLFRGSSGSGGGEQPTPSHVVGLVADMIPEVRRPRRRSCVGSGQAQRATLRQFGGWVGRWDRRMWVGGVRDRTSETGQCSRG